MTVMFKYKFKINKNNQITLTENQFKNSQSLLSLFSLKI